VKPCKLKVDYRPHGINTDALRDGSYVELINLLPLEEMVLTLKRFEMKNMTGWNSIFQEITCRWIEDICATQMHKFLTRSTPLMPFTNIGASMANLIVIPLEEDDIIRGLRKGTVSFAWSFLYEALSVSAKLTGFAANTLSCANLSHQQSNNQISLPRRPDEIPRNVGDTSGHALKCFSSALKAANAKIFIIPYREYQRSGPSGAAKSVIKGLPVAVAAPLSGASEALSFALQGVKHQLRPDLRNEEEVIHKRMKAALDKFDNL